MVLAIYEALQSADIPPEQLKDEDIRVTNPRRLGLSPVIERNIAIAEDRIRRRRKMTDDELAQHIALVLKRPDAELIFHSVGNRLARTVRRVPQGLPWILRRFLIRRRVLKALTRIFGRKVGSFRTRSLVFHASATPLIQADPEGRACPILTGFLHQVISDSTGGTTRVTVADCEGRGGPYCKWVTSPRTVDTA